MAVQDRVLHSCSVPYRTAAEYILPQLDHTTHQGVTFFDARARPPAWMVLELRGRCMPRSSAPVEERETFAIFDDARCRGADLKVGVLNYEV